MRKKFSSKSAFFIPRVLIGFGLCLVCALVALLAFAVYPGASALAQGPNSSNITVVASYHNDTSPPLRDLRSLPVPPSLEREANENPEVPNNHIDSPDPVIQNSSASSLGPMAPNMPSPILNFDGIFYPGGTCFCAPPDTNGAVGLTQYVQIVNEAYQVFEKRTGTPLLPPLPISSIWTGFGGVCESAGRGDPIALYDHLADRWIISQFAGPGVTDECVAVSTTSDATGTYNRYGFHLGSSFFDYPKLSVWPDAYYMSMNVFQGGYVGPQPFALDRSKMLAGLPATFISTTGPLGAAVSPFLPADLEGSTLPPAGAPNTFVGFPGQATPQYSIYRFHVDFATPANSTFSADSSPPPAAPFTALCFRACVPQKNTTSLLDGLGDRLMFRLAYRNFGDHESLVGNYSVSANGAAGVRWFELRNVTSGPVTVFQESTYQPDSTWRWMGSAAMDKQGNLAIGFSASDNTIFPQLRYAGRLASDPLNQLSQGEAHLFDGAGSQTFYRWGDYSSLTVDPVDDSTFWYTSEYYPCPPNTPSCTSSFNWRTRIGSFKFAQPLALVSAVSRKTHGSAGTFDINLPLSGARGIECRSGGANGDYTIVFTFSNPLTAVANARTSCGSVSSSMIDGSDAHNYIVNLTGENACNQQCVTVTLTGVVDNQGNTFTSASATMGLLIGDVNASGRVDAGDVSLVRSQSGQVVTGSNFREDVTVNGLINSSDISLVQAQTLTALPPGCLSSSVSAVSRKTHGSAGNFDIDLPLSGTHGIECRSGGANGDYQIIFTFPYTLAAVANASASCGSVSSSMIDSSDGHNYIVNLTGENACNQQCVTVTLTGVVDSQGNTSSSAPATMGLLVGDVNASARVDSGDVSLVSGQSGQVVGPSNFRDDVTADGFLNSSDISLVRAQTLTALPPGCP
jgi:hypothetical protein